MSRRRQRRRLDGKCGLCSTPVTGTSKTGLCGPCYRTTAGRWWLKQRDASGQTEVPGTV